MTHITISPVIYFYNVGFLIVALVCVIFMYSLLNLDGIFIVQEMKMNKCYGYGNCYLFYSQ